MIFVKKWCNNNSNSLFFANLQHTEGSKGSANFNSLDLIIRKKNKFNFLDTDFVIDFENKKDTLAKFYTINVYNNNYWRIKAYVNNFSYSIYDPKHDYSNFTLLHYTSNSSRDQVLSSFINNFVSLRIDTTSKTKMQSFIRSINAVNGFQIDEKTPFNDLCNVIASKTEDSDCLYPPYKTFIERDDSEQTRKLIDLLYNSFGREYSVDNLINKIITPDGNYSFSQDDNVRITLPKNIFKASSIDDNNKFYLKKNCL